MQPALSSPFAWYGFSRVHSADPTRNKCKRGGIRYMYFYIEQEGQIFLLLIYNKDEHDDLANEQKKWLRDNWERL
jgi:hypothetical protein